MTAQFLNTYPYSPREFPDGFSGDKDDLMLLVSGQLWQRVAEGKRRD